MSQHAGRFSGRVAEYARYRARFPVAVMEILRERCGLAAGDLVADVGAGTGMLAEVLLGGGCRVVAIEPNGEMRRTCVELLGGREGLRVIDAAAEATGLASGSIDLIAVGRAFHWFARDLALAEFRRVLKPGGWVVLLSNRRDAESNDQAREYEQILLEHGTDYAAVRGGYRSYEGQVGYEGGETFAVKLAGAELLGLDEFLGLTQSYSVAPMPGDARYAGMQKALREFFARWSVKGILRVEMWCEVVGWRLPVMLA